MLNNDAYASSLDEKNGAAPHAETITVRLRNQILSGEFPADYHLQEIPLAERLGVSRTPVHEALVILFKEGLLEAGPKRGFKIKTFSMAEIVASYELRGCLEGFAARLLAERGVSDETMARLERCLDTGDALMAGGLSENVQVEWLEMNNEFHSSIVSAVKNPLLQDFVEQSQNFPLASARHVHWYSIDEENFTRARKAHSDHHLIFDAIVNRQSFRASALMEEHIRFSRRLVENHYRDRTASFDSRIGAPLRTTELLSK